MSAVRVMKVVNEELILDKEGLKNIILHSNANNKNVVVISITGALRKGKTTLLNFIKCYLENDWSMCKNNNKKLNGFLAVQGSDPVTKGIMMWSEPIIKTINGEEVAIYLMDTEGTHEIGSNQSASAIIFALSTLLSSLHIFNAKDGIDQRDFEKMVLIGQFAEEVSKSSNQNISQHKLFQKLAIIIRDWISPSDIPFGRASLELVLSKSSRQSTSNECLSLKDELEKYYNEIHCHLLPFPGEKIAFCLDGKKSDFYFNEYKEEFIDKTKLFIEGLLSDNIIKKVRIQKITSLELFNLFIDYYEVFKNGLVVPPDSILKATAKIGYTKAQDVAFSYYKLKIRDFVENSGTSITLKQLHEKMNETFVDTLIEFENTTTFTHPELQSQYLLKLFSNIEEKNQETLRGVENVHNVQRWKKIGLTGAAIGVVGAGAAAVCVGAKFPVDQINIAPETINEITAHITPEIKEFTAHFVAHAFSMVDLTRILNNIRL